MLSEIQYATFANYSPRGSSELSKNSKMICGRVKAGKEKTIKSAFPHLGKPVETIFNSFLNSEAVLVPVPRSAPLSEGAIWPSKIIADLLVENGFGKEVLPCIQRVTAVPKSSSSSSAKDRTSVQNHYDTLAVTDSLFSPRNITLIDDVLTLGRTTFACAMRLHEAFPQANIRVFTLMRTQGFIDNIEKLRDPSVGTISYNPSSGKTSRHP